MSCYGPIPDMPTVSGHVSLVTKSEIIERPEPWISPRTVPCLCADPVLPSDSPTVAPDLGHARVFYSYSLSTACSMHLTLPIRFQQLIHDPFQCLALHFGQQSQQGLDLLAGHVRHIHAATLTWCSLMVCQASLIALSENA